MEAPIGHRDASSLSRLKEYAWHKQALQAKPQHVPQCRLQAEQKRALHTMFLAGARAVGLSNDLWTTGRVAQVEREIFGLSHIQ